MRNSKAALIWITNILQAANIPFQISGGLAAKVYGSTRDLLDIDIDIPEDQFAQIQDKISDFLIFGPSQFTEKPWDLMLMTLNYAGQEIDISGAYHTKIFDQVTQQWVTLTTDFSKSTMHNIFDIEVPVISLADLLAYKKILAREVDLIDLATFLYTK